MRQKKKGGGFRLTLSGGIRRLVALRGKENSIRKVTGKLDRMFKVQT